LKARTSCVGAFERRHHARYEGQSRTLLLVLAYPSQRIGPMAAACSVTPDSAPNPCCSACRQADSPDIRWWHCRVRVPMTRSDRRRNICSKTSIAMCRSIVSLTASAWARAISSAASRPRPAACRAATFKRCGCRRPRNCWSVAPRPFRSSVRNRLRGHRVLQESVQAPYRHDTSGISKPLCPNELRSWRVSPWKVCGLKHDPPISNMSHLGALPFRGWYGSAFAHHSGQTKDQWE
jgi:hypothetical protein